MNNQRIEVGIVRLLIQRCEAAGFSLHSVADSDGEVTEVASADEAMKLMFNLDDCTLRFKGKLSRLEGVLLIFGNGEDVVSDWSAGDDAFNQVLESVCDAIEGHAIRFVPCPGDVPAWDNRPRSGPDAGRGVCIHCGTYHGERR